MIERDVATAKEKSIRIRVTEHEYLKLHAYAVRHLKTASQVLREYIHRLPDFTVKEELED